MLLTRIKGRKQIVTNEKNHVIRSEIKAMWAFLKDSGWFSHELFTSGRTSYVHPSQQVTRIQQTLAAARSAQEDLANMSRLLSSRGNRSARGSDGGPRWCLSGGERQDLSNS